MTSLEVWFSSSYPTQTDFTVLLKSTLTQKFAQRLDMGFD